jgi:acyl-CoA thioesterase-2
VTAVESAWPRYPGYAIDLVPLDGIGRARVGDRLVAESSRCLIVRESDHRDQLYFPLADVDADVLVDSAHRTICPFKGEARHSSVRIGGTLVEHALWAYPTPMDEVAGIAGYGAFYTELVEVTAAVPFADGDEAVTRFPIWGTARELAELMDVVPTGDRTYTAPTFPNPPVGTFVDMAWHGERRNVVEGGQLLGAAIVAAAKARPDQRVTSAHIALLKAASFDEPLDVSVDPRRLGSMLSTFDVELEQAGALRASALVMTDAGADDLIRHAEPMPDVPPPSACPRLDFGVLGRDVRVVGGAYSLEPGAVGPPELHLWTRFADAPDSPAIHQALLAQATTHYSINAALRPHEGISEGDAHRTISTGPVNATIAFHDEVDVTEWLLTETRSIWAGRGSTQSQIRVFTADGRLVASKTLQAIIRSFRQSPDQLGQGFSTAM